MISGFQEIEEIGNEYQFQCAAEEIAPCLDYMRVHRNESA
ncbi:hypothetical protein PAECIP111893_00197 [Paenibacillus plantiphilus]|uniref:Uncharacterized protein n=1 Tax=Paenibacillus plantiphilus TaxID=2905650 RepID=A0ABN8FUL4_9BACL|nr:hypothetical protein PAECIP111893_00197 [Paenibacillus plantiphilus]